MYSVPPPRRDDCLDYRTISNARRNPAVKQALLSKAGLVEAAYAEYENAGGNPEQITVEGFGDAALAAMLENCDALDTGRPFGSLRQEILSSARDGQCPMCGRGQVATLDHYLPKAHYPQFSIFSRNLIPACHRCNFKKGDIIGKAAGRFLHAYFDALPERSILRVKTHVSDTVTLTYYINLEATVDELTLRNAAFHFEKLQLAPYYQAEATSELADRVEALDVYYGPDGDADLVRDYLTREASSIQSAKGLNHWKTALFSSLAADPDFCDGGFRLLMPDF
ncbi:HNH endonuclease [Micromonospora sp. NPDC093277]|uniref:HNH endonuclease n=1 Tax=Micromonospora sp. NPDC093277 TaxID=3364291 RepID=UPI0038007AD0